MHENKYPRLTHPRDPRFLILRSLQTSPGRSRTGLYITEGVRHLARAVEHGAPIQSIFLEPSVLCNPFGQKLTRRLRSRGIPGIQLSRQLYRELTLVAEPQGVGAIIRQTWSSLLDLKSRLNSLWLAIESIESPGNLGTMVRRAEAAGTSGIFILNSTCDPYDPATIRATMGSLFSQKLVRCLTREFTDWARKNGVAMVASSPSGLIDFKALEYRFPTVLLIGSEKLGLSDGLLEVADYCVRISMRGGCDSINAAVAAGVLLFEMASRRKGGCD